VGLELELGLGKECNTRLDVLPIVDCRLLLQDHLLFLLGRGLQIQFGFFHIFEILGQTNPNEKDYDKYTMRVKGLSKKIHQHMH
jgi:hypothetical protein